jgi:hypothetical protein
MWSSRTEEKTREPRARQIQPDCSLRQTEPAHEVEVLSARRVRKQAPSVDPE